MWMAILILAAVGVFFSPDLRSNPVAVILAVLTLLGAVGLLYGRWLKIRSQQSMIDLERRSRDR